MILSAGLDLNKVFDSEQQLLSSNRYFRDARFQIGVLIIIIVLNIGLAINSVSAILLGFGLLIVIATQPPLGRTMLFFIAPLFPTLIAAIGISVTTGITPFLTIGPLIIYEEGLYHGFGVILRVYCDVTWLAITMITIPFNQILKALRWYRVPTILVDTLALMYRYAFLLHEEFTRMNMAALSRGGRNSQWQTIKTLSRITAQIFMRTYDRSERIFQAMVARGGEQYESTEKSG